MLNWLTGGVIKETLALVRQFIPDAQKQADTQADLIKEHYRQRADWMRAGGFWLMLIFAVPLAVWWAAVILYSLIWCAGCAFPQSWSIAALPGPLNEWAWLIVVSIFGVIGADRWGRK